jgi:hypothetical protein
MTDDTRRPRYAERDRAVTDAGVDVDEIGVNRAGLGSPPANIDDSHRPDLFDIAATPLRPAGPDEDPGSAGGLGSGLGDTREAPFASRPVGGAGVGAVSAVAAEEFATESAETGATRAVGSVGSTDPQEPDAELDGVAESDMGAVSMSGAERPGAGLGETRGGHPGPLPDTV